MFYMSENNNNFESQSEKGILFQFDKFEPEKETYSMFDDYLL